MPAVLLSGRLPSLSALVAACLLLVLAAGCRSSQTAYRFRPGSSPVAEASSPDTAVSSGPLAVPHSALKAAARPHSRTTGPKLRQRRQAERLLARVAARVEKAPVRLTHSRPAAQAIRRVAGPGHQTEVGLGTTVLGVLGLVVLPVALLGLLIWGGPVWAILGGLAALAVLVAYLDPFA